MQLSITCRTSNTRPQLVSVLKEFQCTYTYQIARTTESVIRRQAYDFILTLSSGNIVCAMCTGVQHRFYKIMLAM